MKVLGIMGSPRIGGNTQILLDAALKEACAAGAEAETLLVDRLDISPCREYHGCLEDGNCVIRDDMDAIYPKLLSADIVIVAAPMFFYGLPAQLKALIDRGQALWARQHVLNQQFPPGRRGAFIGVGATRGPKLFDGAILTVRYFFKAIGVSYAAELLVRGVDARGDIRRRPDALAQAAGLGQKLVSGG